MSEELVIPEDLRSYYDACVELVNNKDYFECQAQTDKAFIERIARAEAENEQWKTWGVIEIAVRNPNVAEYVRHWEARTLKAEARVKELEATVARREAMLDTMSANNDAMRLTIERMSAPMSTEETAYLYKLSVNSIPERVNEIIANRAKEPKP